MPKDKLKAGYSKDELEAYLLHERGHFNVLGRTMSAVYSFIMILVLFNLKNLVQKCLLV